MPPAVNRRSATIVGAGIIGSAIARELASRGVACTVVDPRPVGGGATQASAGMLAPYVEAHAGGPMLDLCVRSLELYDDWIAGLRREGAEIDYGRIGTLEIALTAERAAALQRGHGDWLEPAAVASALPQLAPTAGALRNDQHGFVDARQLAYALAESAQRRGAQFVRARVERIDRRAGLFTVDLGPLEALDASAIILAAGAWTSRIRGVRTPPLRPVRGQLLRLNWGHGRLSTILWGPDCYIVPLSSGGRGLLVGATVEDAGFDERVTDAAVDGLFEAARRLLPSLSRGADVEARVGLRPAAPDELPVLGDDPAEPGVIHASGHYRNGVLLAPVTAKLIGDLVVDERRDPCLDHFCVDRFN
jgi:glycine oxidase ThiO